MYNAALYIRTSTINQKDSIKQQRNTLKKYCDFKGYGVFDEYVDYGVTGRTADRPQLKRLMEDAETGQFDIVLVTKLDRFARSIMDCLNSIQFLEDHNIKFAAVEQPIDTSDHYGRLSLQIMAAFSEFERNIIAERMEAGRKEATKRGVQCHRPKQEIPYKEVLDLVEKGLSANAMAKYFGVGPATMHRRLKEYGFVYDPEIKKWGKK